MGHERRARNKKVTLLRAHKTAHLQRAGEEVVLGDDVHKEVGGDLAELVVQDGDEVHVEGVVLHHGFLGAAQQVQELLPVLESLVHVPQQEAHKGKLELTCKAQRGDDPRGEEDQLALWA